MNPITYLTPPLVGAFIGWTTNYIAIRMLFRPLKPWRIFGIRVPMTPGVIPGKRHDLAVNIGNMVGSHLLTSGDISKALSEAAFKQELESVIQNRVGEILTRDLGPLPTLIPERFRVSFEAGVHVLRLRALNLIHQHIDSPEFSAGLGATISSHLDSFLARSLESWLPGEQREHLFDFLNKTLHEVVRSPKAAAWLRDYVNARLAAIIEQGKSLDDLLPQELIDVILGLLAKETPGLLGKAAQFVGEPLMRAKMVTTISGAIGSFISGLGPLAAMAGAFLSPEIIESKVNAILDDKGDEIAAWLTDDLTQAKTSAALTEKAKSFLSRPLKEMLADFPPEKLDSIQGGISLQILAFFQNPEVSASLTALLREALETQAARPSQDILTDLLGGAALTRGKHRAAQEVVSILRSSKTKRILDDIIGSLVQKNLLGQPLGALAKLLPKDVQTGICDYLLQQSHALLLEEVPRLVDFVNIQRIVTRKVDSLDLLRLEGLLLSIMEEQFKYINLFGGVLGFIIGLFNLVFLL
ncbi:MAG: DUF445 family protein [Desulfobulbaceae bacterium]|nr:DUF445 family protein [Desulfobulbaceae bacterium]